MWLYVDKDYLDFEFECNKSLNKLQTFTEKRNGVEATLNIVRLSNDKKSVMINAWSNKNSSGLSNLIFTQKVPYIKNQRYEIKYYFEKTSRVLRCDLMGDGDNFVESESGGFAHPRPEIYECKMFMNPKLAKKEYRYLHKHKLIGNNHWDNFDNWWNIVCNACHIKGELYQNLSCPSVGYVFKNINSIKSEKTSFVSDSFFVYKGITYIKIPDKECHKLTFWTKEDFEKLKPLYKPTEKTFTDPETLDKALKNWEKDWDFDLLWERDLTQKDIDDNGNVYGGAWKTCNGEIHPKDWGKHLDLDEKVVTKGWHTTIPEGSIPCPVCTMLYDISRANPKCYLPMFHSLRENAAHRELELTIKKNKKEKE